MFKRVVPVLLAFITTTVLAVGYIAPSETDPSTTEQDSASPPFDLMDKSHINAGKETFNRNCNMFCHGNEGSGGKTAAFKGRADFTPGDLYDTIANGDKTMPAWKEKLSAERRWELVAYILYLGRQR